MTIRRKAAVTSFALSTLFVVVYGSCLWVTSLRPQVGSIYFEWERHIPFVPIMILPYMSIDLFFVAAPFLAGSDRELKVFVRRIAAAIILAGICFLLFPLKFYFKQPQVDGILGVIFNNFRVMDRPFNEFPSLHIALWAILFDMYLRHLKGMWRWLAAFWFVLIGVSPLLTYQHHVIDVLGGLALAAVCFYVFRDQSMRQPFIGNRRIACYYAGGAVVAAILSFAFRPWSYALLWPAVAMAIAAGGYLFWGPGIFRKEHGRIPWSSWLLLWPVLLGHRVSLIYYARQCRPYDCVMDRLWIGRRLSTAEARMACADGVTAVVDLAGEFSEAQPFRKLAYLQLAILDLTAPNREQMDAAVAFIREHVGNGIVYVHCKIGYSRSTAIVGAYLLETGQVDSVEDAVAWLRRVRPRIVVRAEVVAALREFAKRPDGIRP